MKKVMYSVFYLSLIGILITACQKKEVESQDSNEIINKSPIVLGSSDNPYNYIGILHNQILDDLESSFDAGLSNEEVYNLVVEYVDTDLEYESIEFYLSDGGYDEAIINYEAGPNFYADFDQMLSDELISENQYLYLNDILDIGSSNPCNDCTLDEAVRIAIESIGEIENAIIDNPELTVLERNSLLIYSSISKYSMDFWRIEAQQPSSNYSITLLTGVGTEEDYINGLPWYAKDAAGAFTAFQVAAVFLAAPPAGEAVVLGVTIVGAAVSSMG